MICCICNNPILVQPGGYDQGDNAEPLKEGRCCAICNAEVVVPFRIGLLFLQAEDGGDQ